MPKQAESKLDGVINPQIYNFNQFEHGNFMLSKRLTSHGDLYKNIAVDEIGRIICSHIHIFI